jgi:hypothetical protein
MRAAGYGGGIEMPSGLNGTSFGVSLIQQLRAVRNVVNNRGEKDNARQQRYQLRVFEDSVQYASSSHRTASRDDLKRKRGGTVCVTPWRLGPSSGQL